VYNLEDVLIEETIKEVIFNNKIVIKDLKWYRHKTLNKTFRIICEKNP